MCTKLDSYINFWPFTRKRAIMAFRFRMEFRLEPIWKKFAFVQTTWVIRSKKICIRSNGLITRSIETSSRSNDLLTRLVKASIHSNDLLNRSIKTSNRSNDLLTRLLNTIQPFERLAHLFHKHINDFLNSEISWVSLVHSPYFEENPLNEIFKTAACTEITTMLFWRPEFA